MLYLEKIVNFNMYFYHIDYNVISLIVNIDSESLSIFITHPLFIYVSVVPLETAIITAAQATADLAFYLSKLLNYLKNKI